MWQQHVRDVRLDTDEVHSDWNFNQIRLHPRVFADRIRQEVQNQNRDGTDKPTGAETDLLRVNPVAVEAAYRIGQNYAHTSRHSLSLYP